MAKRANLTADGVYRPTKTGYITVDELYKKIAKAYATVNGVYRQCWDSELVVTYTGDMIDQIVTMSGVPYRLLTLTSSGTLTVSRDTAAEVWMCGGGTSGIGNVGNLYGSPQTGGGGAGAFTASGTVTLTSSMTAVVGAGGAKVVQNSRRVYYNHGSASSFMGIETSVAFSSHTSQTYLSGISGGTGGGMGGSGFGSSNGGGTGDGVTKYPFGDSAYFAYPHCAGGGGGSYKHSSASSPYTSKGGDGGTNGGNGGTREAIEEAADTISVAEGGFYGGGHGGGRYNIGDAASYYGSGGGGAGHNEIVGDADTSTGGAGYQGVIYIRIPVME